MDGQTLFRAFEAFAGGGLVHLALDKAGIEVALANDLCLQKAETYRANFPGTPFDGRSIADLRASDLPSVEVVTASSPCQDHSVNNMVRTGATAVPWHSK